jgi:hypothetical protein
VRRILAMSMLAIVLTAAAASAVPLPGAPGCPVFPSNNVWHADVSALPVHPRSAAWLASASASSRNLHPDFGTSGDPSAPYGIPYHVVSSSHAKVSVSFDYDDESDPGPYPLGDDTPIEGGAGSGGDMHTVVVDKDTCTLYETWYTQQTAAGWTAGSGAIWSLKSNVQRPAGWTSADAAGLPILPGLLRLDEVQAGVVDHAIRFTVSRTDRSYVWPARHHAGSVNDPDVPPMGARFRLKASYDVSGFSASTRVVLAAMKKHGLLLADNGSNWYFQGAASNSWPGGLISELKTVPASAFEAVDASSLMVSPDSMAVRPKAPTWTHWSAPSPSASPATSPPAAAPQPRRSSAPAAPAPSSTRRPASAPPSSRPPAPTGTPLPGTARPAVPAAVAEPPATRRRSASQASGPAWWVVLPFVGGAVALLLSRRRLMDRR